jgi:DNA polymerase III subunit delta'
MAASISRLRSRRSFQGKGPGVRRDMHKLADILAAKDAETIFDFFSALIGNHVIDAARTAARSGDIIRAERFARFSASLNERLTISEAYNLDRKQTVLSLLDDLRDVTAA